MIDWRFYRGRPSMIFIWILSLTIEIYTCSVFGLCWSYILLSALHSSSYTHYHCQQPTQPLIYYTTYQASHRFTHHLRLVTHQAISVSVGFVRIRRRAKLRSPNVVIRKSAGRDWWFNPHELAIILTISRSRQWWLFDYARNSGLPFTSSNLELKTRDNTQEILLVLLILLVLYLYQWIWI